MARNSVFVELRRAFHIAGREVDDAGQDDLDVVGARRHVRDNRRDVAAGLDVARHEAAVALRALDAEPGRANDHPGPALLVPDGVVDAVAVAGVAHQGHASRRIARDILARHLQHLVLGRVEIGVALVEIEFAAVEKHMRMRLDEARHDKGHAPVERRIRRASIDCGDPTVLDRDEIRTVLGRMMQRSVEVAVGPQAKRRHRQAL